MLPLQGTLKFSKFAGLYDIVVPKDHELRRLNEFCGDFGFILDELRDKYCLDNGRMAEDPRMLFKYLLLKTIYNLSDVDVVRHSKYDMSFKMFLGLAPEDDVIDPSTLCKFRKQRLSDEGLLDKLIAKTVEIARENGLIKTGDIIMDSTHTHSRANAQAPLNVLRKIGKQLRKAVYALDETAKGGMPAKYEGTDLEKEAEYVETLLEHVAGLSVSQFSSVFEKCNLLREKLEEVRDHYDVSKDGDARRGHKTSDSSFFGYKTHIAISQERIITAATVTSGEKSDGSQMQALIDKSVENGVEVDTVIGDGAYCSRENLRASGEKGVAVVAKLNANVSGSKNDDRFTFNKDAGMYVCPAGHMSVRKRTDKENKAQTYYFDTGRCAVCRMREGCFRHNQKSKTYTVCRRTREQEEQRAFQETDGFREKYRTRYKIEAKNADLKNNYGYGRAESYGLQAVTLQGAVAMFACNMRRIMRLMGGKETKKGAEKRA